MPKRAKPDGVYVGRLRDEVTGVELVIYRPDGATLQDVYAALQRFKGGNAYVMGANSGLPVPKDFADA